MKLLILSDIHSNICALDAILARETDADAIYCAGDLTDYGPFPHEVIARFRERGIKTVMGNHDRNLLRVWEDIKNGKKPETQEDIRWVHYNCGKMDGEDIAYLAALPDTLEFIADGCYYRITHQYDRGYGRPQSIFDFDNFIGERPAAAEGLPTRLILGHSHRQAVCQFRDGRLFLNPGSISYRRPDDPDKEAHYAVILDGEITLKAVPYDLAPLQDVVRRLTDTRKMNEKELAHASFYFGITATDMAVASV